MSSGSKDLDLRCLVECRKNNLTPKFFQVANGKSILHRDNIPEWKLKNVLHTVNISHDLDEVLVR